MLKAGYSLAEFCWFCCLLPKNESHLRAGRRERLERSGNGAFSLRMPDHVLPSPSSRADPDELVECAGERGLVIKSRLNRDVDQRHCGLAHQLFGSVNAMLNQPLVSGDAERGFER